MQGLYNMYPTDAKQARGCAQRRLMTEGHVVIMISFEHEEKRVEQESRDLEYAATLLLQLGPRTRDHWVGYLYIKVMQ